MSSRRCTTNMHGTVLDRIIAAIMTILPLAHGATRSNRFLPCEMWKRSFLMTASWYGRSAMPGALPSSGTPVGNSGREPTAGFMTAAFFVGEGQQPFVDFVLTL